MLTTIDLVVIVIYLGVLTAIGLAFARRQTSEDAYFLGNRRLPWGVVGVSVMATIISTLTYLSLPGEMIAHGTGYFFSVFALVLVIPVANLLIIPALRRMPITTVYEYFDQRYNSAARMVGAAAFVFSRLLWIGLIIYTTSFAVQEMTGYPTVSIILVLGVVTTFYTTAGGMPAVVWTDFVQGLLLLGGAAFVPIFVMVQTGAGPDTWWQTFSEAGRSRAPVFSLDLTVRISVIGIILNDLVWNLCTHGSDQVAAQRYLSTPTVRDAQRSLCVFSACAVALILLLGIVGLALFHFEFTQTQQPMSEFAKDISERADRVFPAFIAEQLPPGVSGLLMAAILAAAMSSLSSGINSITSVVTRDFLDRASADKQTSPPRMARVKTLAALAGVVGIGSALLVYMVMQRSEWNLVEMIGRLNGLFVAPLGVLFLVGIISRRVGAAAALWGFAAGSATSIVVAFRKELFGATDNISFMWIMPFSFLVSFLVSYLASLFCAPPSRETLTVLGMEPDQRSENSSSEN